MRVGIETDAARGCSADRGRLHVYAVNPLQAARYRERHSVSGAKSDTADAHILADMVRTDRTSCAPSPATAPKRRRSRWSPARTRR